jgi:hypothetical protein
MRVLVASAGVAAALTVAPCVWANPSARLAYARSVDAAACPDEPALRKAVAARFGYDPFFPWAQQTVIVQVWRDHGRYASRIQVIDERGLMRGTRELTSDDADCSDLFDATALAISIALDASIANTPPPSSPPPSPNPPPEPLAVLPLPVPVMVDRAPPPTPPRRGPGFALGLDTVETAGLAPKVSPGLAIFGEVRGGAVSFGLEVRLGASLPSNVYPPTARIEAAQAVVGLVPCAHWGPVFACAVGEFGWFQAWGAGLAHDGSNGLPFAAVGARLGAHVPLSSSLYVRLYAEATVDLDRPELELDDESVWLAPPFAGSLGAGLGVKIP